MKIEDCGLYGRTWTQFIQQVADDMHNVEIGFFVPAADVVHLAQKTLFQHAADRTATILHIQPVADLLAVTVHRQRFASQGIDDQQRNQFFGEMIRAVVV